MNIGFIEDLHNEFKSDRSELSPTLKRCGLRKKIGI